MREHLQSHIKPLMDRHPALGPILETAGIGCTTCSLGTCRIVDILDIHNLDTQQTQSLLQAMGEIIHGGEPFEVPHLERKAAPVNSAFCPPIARMVEEHTHIKRFLALIPDLVQALHRDPDATLPLLARGLDFIRNYADRYHHAKEEDILFGFFDKADILEVMLQDHVQGRAHVQAMAEGIATRHLAAIETHLRAYGELLNGHIQREDTILYPWMDRTLTTRQVGELFARCMEVEARFGGQPAEYEAFVAALNPPQ